MALYPEVQAKAQAEIAASLKDQSAADGSRRTISLADRPHVPYTSALVRELLCWHPIVPLTPRRVGKEDDNDVVSGGRTYRIPAGSLIMINMWKMLQDPEVYEQPKRFIPERYLVPSPASDPETYAFGFGRRYIYISPDPKTNSFGAGTPSSAVSHFLLENGTREELVYMVPPYVGGGDLFTVIAERHRYIGDDALVTNVTTIQTRKRRRVIIGDFGLATTDRWSRDFGCSSSYYTSPVLWRHAPQRRPDPRRGARKLDNRSGTPGGGRVAARPDFKSFWADPGRFLMTILPILSEANAVFTRVFEQDQAWRGDPIPQYAVVSEYTVSSRTDSACSHSSLDVFLLTLIKAAIILSSSKVMDSHHLVPVGRETLGSSDPVGTEPVDPRKVKCVPVPLIPNKPPEEHKQQVLTKAAKGDSAVDVDRSTSQEASSPTGLGFESCQVGSKCLL
ncbi:hypothetical protein FRC06_005963, partial [Ceratobasidium sp. 370]